MSNEIEIPKDDISGNLGLHPVSENEEADTPEGRLRKAVTIILHRKQPLDHLVFVTPEGMRTIHLAFPHYEKTDKISFMFKRCPELKLYYPKIRSWFEANNLEWKDCSFNNERYMRIDIEPNLESITTLVSSAQEEIFVTEISKAITLDNGLGLHNALLGFRAPILLLFSVAGILLSVIFYPLYQIYNLKSLGSFSFVAIDWTEGFLLSIFVLGILSLRYCSKDITRKKKPRKWWVIPFWLTILLFIALAFFTY